MAFNREIMEKEIEVASMHYEHAVDSALAVSDISLFMEAGENESILTKVKATLAKIQKAVKDFFEKIKIIIDEKVKEFKHRADMRAIKKMWSQNVNNKITINGFYDEMTLNKAVKMGLRNQEEYLKAVEKISLDTKLTDEQRAIKLSKAIGKFNKEIDKIDGMIFKAKKKYEMKCKGDPNAMIAWDETEKTYALAANEVMETLTKSSNKYINDVNSERINREISKAVTTAAAKTTGVIQKCGKVASENKKKIIAALVAISSAAAIGVAAGKSKKNDAE